MVTWQCWRCQAVCQNGLWSWRNCFWCVVLNATQSCARRVVNSNRRITKHVIIKVMLTVTFTATLTSGRMARYRSGKWPLTWLMSWLLFARRSSLARCLRTTSANSRRKSFSTWTPATGGYLLGTPANVICVRQDNYYISLNIYLGLWAWIWFRDETWNLLTWNKPALSRCIGFTTKELWNWQTELVSQIVLQ